MILGIRDKETNKLLMKDVLDIDFDMSVFEEEGKYYINVNNKYILPDEFTSEHLAEQRMIDIAIKRNALEQELRDF